MNETKQDFEFKKTTPMPVKAEAVKKILRRDLDQNMSLKEMIVYTKRLICYRKGLRKKLGVIELKVKEIFDKNNINPNSVYRWLRYTIVPEDIIRELEQFKTTRGVKPFTSQRRMLEIDESRIRKKKAEIGLMVLELGRQTIYDLDRIKYG